MNRYDLQILTAKGEQIHRVIEADDVTSEPQGVLFFYRHHQVWKIVGFGTAVWWLECLPETTEIRSSEPHNLS